MIGAKYPTDALTTNLCPFHFKARIVVTVELRRHFRERYILKDEPPLSPGERLLHIWHIPLLHRAPGCHAHLFARP
jgi:hypothetical protein